MPDGQGDARPILGRMPMTRCAASPALKIIAGRGVSRRGLLVKGRSSMKKAPLRDGAPECVRPVLAPLERLDIPGPMMTLTPPLDQLQELRARRLIWQSRQELERPLALPGKLRGIARDR